jgi:vanadium-dependent haloperoxidase-like protein
LHTPGEPVNKEALMRRITRHRVHLLTACLGLILAASSPQSAAAERVANWNAVAVTATVMSGHNGVVSSRALAITQVAVHDALNAIERRYKPYALHGTTDPGASPDAAIAAAAHDALVGLIAVGILPFVGFGTATQQAAAVAFVNAQYAADLATIPDGAARARGIAVGQAAARAILARRSVDGATTFVLYTPGTRPGDWQPTPNPSPFDPPAGGERLPAVLPGWGKVTPFVLRSSSQFEPRRPPSLESQRYARDYNEVMAIGEKSSISRTPEQTQIARFWYEGSPAGWSRIGRVVGEVRGLDSWQRARLLALMNLAMADGFIAGMETKYTFNFWRPVTAIRAGDTDGNDDTIADPNWSSLLNSPAIPDYTSTHSILGAAAAAVLRRFFGDDDVAFQTTSGVPFGGITRSFQSFSEAARENGDSRIYAGIHFRSAVEEGIRQGSRIGRFVFTHALRPIEGDEDERDWKR